MTSLQQQLRVWFSAHSPATKSSWGAEVPLLTRVRHQPGWAFHHPIKALVSAVLELCRGSWQKRSGRGGCGWRGRQLLLLTLLWISSSGTLQLELSVPLQQDLRKVRDEKHSEFWFMLCAQSSAFKISALRWELFTALTHDQELLLQAPNAFSLGTQLR